MKCPLRNLSHFIIPWSPATIDSLFSPTRMSHKISDNGALDETSNKNISMLSENSEWPIYFFTERSRFQAVTKNPDNRFCSIIFLNHALSFSSWLNGDIRNLYRLYDNLVYNGNGHRMSAKSVFVHPVYLAVEYITINNYKPIWTEEHSRSSLMSHSELNQRAQTGCPFHSVYHYNIIVLEVNMLVSFIINK